MVHTEFLVHTRWKRNVTKTHHKASSHTETGIWILKFCQSTSGRTNPSRSQYNIIQKHPAEVSTIILKKHPSEVNTIIFKNILWTRVVVFTSRQPHRVISRPITRSQFIPHHGEKQVVKRQVKSSLTVLCTIQSIANTTKPRRKEEVKLSCCCV